MFKNESPCGLEVFTIDRSTKSVNGVGHLINADWPLCNIGHNPQRETKWAYHFVDGFKVYWELRQKARPMPLRLIQTLFGN